MYRCISDNEIVPFILRGDRGDDNPTIWGLRPQKVAQGNRNYAGYMKASGKHTDDALAKAMTRQDLTRFLSCVAWVRNVDLGPEGGCHEHIDDEETLTKLFWGLDYNTYTELTGAAHDVFALREGEKKELSSSSGAASNGSTRTGSDSIASGA